MAGERPRTVGVSRTLRKPIDRRQLLDAICELLDRDAIAGEALLAGTDVAPLPLVGLETKVPAIPLRILVAEDNAVNQRLIQKILVNDGHSVTLAADGLEAVEAWSNGSFDVILMDVQMPKAGGVEATREIRCQERSGRRIPIIALTAHAMGSDRERCLCAGMDDYLTKPINVGALRRALEVVPPSAPPSIAQPKARADGAPVPANATDATPSLQSA